MNRYLEAARPRTLPAAVTPVVVGTAAAMRPVDQLHLDRAVLALVVALSLQVAVNYANDLADGVRGVDTAERVGPRRAVASGDVSPKAMRLAVVAALTVAVLAGGALAWLVGPELLVVGAVAILAALGYSGGRRPYASLGLGEVGVFVFFGVVATAGSAYVQDAAVTLTPVLASVPVGFVAVALLVVNNLRDIPTDEAADKRTLAVRLGEVRTRLLYQVLIVSAVAWVIPIAFVVGSAWPLVALTALPLAVPPLLQVHSTPIGAGLVTVLELTGRFQLLFAVLLAVGFLAAEVV